MKEKSKVLSKLVGLAAVVCLMAMLFGMTTMAADKVVPLVPKQNYDNFDADYNVIKYHKITIKSPSVVYVAGFSQYPGSGHQSGVSIMLCNSAKRDMRSYSDYVNVQEGQYYALNKGTYYLKVRTNNYYRIAYNAVKVKDISGKKASKARALKKGAKKETTGLIMQNESGGKVDYYKITLKKAQKVTLLFQANGTSTICMKIVPNNKNVRLYGNTMYVHNQTRKWYVKKKLPKGTYTIKVYRSLKKKTDSAVYAIKWR